MGNFAGGMGLVRHMRRVALLALCTVMACSSGDDGDTPSETPEEVSVEIGEQGGTLKVKGATLAIPEGALDEQVVLTAKNRGKSAEPPAKVKKQVSDLVEFGPEGTTFKKDVELSFDLDSEEPKAKVYFTREDDPNKFEELPTTTKGKKVTAKVKHFSKGFVAIPEDVEAPDAGEADAGSAEAGAPTQDAGSSDDAGTGAGLDAQTPPDASTSQADAGTAEAGTGLDSSGPLTEASVPDAGPSAGHITVSSRDSAGSLVSQTWVAFQDGDGAWQRVLPAKPGVYEFDVKSPRYGVTLLCADQTNANSDGTLSYFPSSKTALDVLVRGTACGATPPTYQIQGNLVLPANHDFYRYGHYNIGGAIQSPVGAGPRTWVISSFPGNDTQDLVLGASIDATQGLSSFIIFRDLLISQPAMLDADFIKTGTAAGPTYMVTLSNASAATNVDTYYVTRNATMGLPLRQSATTSPSGTSRSMMFATVPASIARPTDAYVVRATESSTSSTRMITQRFNTAGNFALALPTALGGVLSMVKTPYNRPSMYFGDYPSATKYVLNWVSTPTAGVRRSFETTIDPGWFTETGSHTVTFPDFSGAPGFDPIWVLPANPTGQTVSMEIQAHVTYPTSDGEAATRATVFSSVQLN